jgi:hypothetical protein
LKNADDVTRFMNQVKHMTKIAPLQTDTTVLPREKSQDRFEAITINYVFEETDEIEQLVMHIRMSSECRISMEDFFLIPKAPVEDEITMF